MNNVIFIEVEYLDEKERIINFVKIDELDYIEFKNDRVFIWKKENESNHDLDYILNPEYFNWEQKFRIKINGYEVFRWNHLNKKGMINFKNINKLTKKLVKQFT